MAAEWYYAKNKHKVGPVTEAQMHELVRTGELSRNDMVWKQGMAKWQPAGSVDGLLPKSPPVQQEPPPLPDTTRPMTNAWLERFKRNKPAYLSALFAVALPLTCICGPIMDFVLGVFPEGLRAILGFLYFLFMVGLFIALVVAGIIALVGWSTRAERESNLWGKWEPVSGEGCSLWFYQDGGFLRNDGLGAKYVFDPHKDIITICWKYIRLMPDANGGWYGPEVCASCLRELPRKPEYSLQEREAQVAQVERQLRKSKKRPSGND